MSNSNFKANYEQIITNKDKQVRAGIDIGGTNIKLGLVDENNQIVVSASIPTRVAEGALVMIKDIAEALIKLLGDNHIELNKCAGIGIGCPGTIDSIKGIVKYSNNINWENIELIKELQTLLPLPAAIENDANCAALGEWKAGSGTGCEDMVLLTIGTGLGSGIICNGSLFTGGAPGGGEIGHSILYRDGKLCTCGRRGCAEAYVSASALKQEGIRTANEHPHSTLYHLCRGNLDAISAKTVFDAAQTGDASAQNIINEFLNNLGAIITDIINIFRPEKILLGGGVCEQGSALIEPIKKYIKKNAFGGSHIMLPEILKASLGNQAGIIGAANLINI